MSVSTSWQSSAGWYIKNQGNSGDYYHKSIVIPKSLRLLNLNPDSSLLDLACGQGVLARALPKTVDYLGLDISQSLINNARKLSRHQFLVRDVARPFSLPRKNFTRAALILSLQNIEKPEIAINNAAKHLITGGFLLIVLNHPCFRIPRQSSWGIDPQNQIEYRRINRYLSPLRIPVTTHPGDKNSPVTWSFHSSLSSYALFLKQAGFIITDLEEWASDKASVGRAAGMENRARSEFPLFLTILARKV